MKVLFVGGDDWAHLCHRHAKALRSIGHAAWVWTQNAHPFYPQPLESWVGTDPLIVAEAMRYAAHADWIITSGDGDYRMLDMVLRELGPDHKPLIGSTHAGTAFRTHPEKGCALDREFGSKIQFVGWDSLALGREHGSDLNFHPYWAPTTWMSANKIPGVPLRVLHAPTNRVVKGTERILEGVAIAKSRGMDVSFQLLENVSNDEVVSAMLRADVYIDQLMPGPVKGFGVSSLEALAVGCIVLADMSTLQGDAFDLVPPILNVQDEAQIAETLLRLADDRSAWLAVNKLWHQTHGSFEAVGYRWEKLLLEARK